MTEFELIKYCKQKNSVAQRILFDKYYNSVYHLGYRYLSNHHDVEDILSISFSKAFKNIKRFEYQGEDSFKRWLNTIVINESIRFLNKKKVLLFNDIGEKGNLGILSEQIQIHQLDIESFYLIIEKLNDLNRLVFNMYVVEGYKHKEIAGKLNITVSNSKTILSRTKSIIRQQLSKNENYETTK
ncbi:MAG: sigma-70 family RNA polymerase sigma factor [Saprospiraceae bacterium]|nr:sigma-70 family RNA polymerase sigma factor [Saprospiraceae bacterium]